MIATTLYDHYKRYRTLHTGRITSLPVIILMPHSGCNCRCVMCDIWKGNHLRKQLTEKDIAQLIPALKMYQTEQVVMSGGEALLNTDFFRLCALIKQMRIRITLLSAGLSLTKHAAELVRWTDDLIVSLDGPQKIHDEIRNVPDAFKRLRDGIAAIKLLRPGYPVSGRTVIHKYNFREWPRIVDAARQIGLDSISFLPADVSSTAFNRAEPWNTAKQDDILIAEEELPVLQNMITGIIKDYAREIESGFIVEPASKLKSIYQYYAACHGQLAYPYKNCNAPWVSAVIEADGSVRPCFFHQAIGNLNHEPLTAILNSKTAIDFRQALNIETNDTCRKCVCSLHLPVGARLLRDPVPVPDATSAGVPRTVKQSQR